MAYDCVEDGACTHVRARVASVCGRTQVQVRENERAHVRAITRLRILLLYEQKEI